MHTQLHFTDSEIYGFKFIYIYFLKICVLVINEKHVLKVNTRYNNGTFYVYGCLRDNRAFSKVAFSSFMELFKSSQNFSISNG